MLQTGDNETEILLGNKQLLGIFVVVVILLGIAFAGGYMLGKGQAQKQASLTPATQGAGQGASDSKAEAPGQTRTVTPSDTAINDGTQDQAAPAPLGSRKRNAVRDSALEHQQPTSFAPASGQTFLQVAAVTRNEALGIADVLHKKGFRAHAVPVPGNDRMYRVLVGPVQDPADLSANRDRLRQSGFAKVFVQHY
jgi:cell division septation protein DedD